MDHPLPKQIISERPRPRLIAIVGGSGSGKSWLAGRLQEILVPDTSRICQDDFYLDRSHLSPARRAQINFDHPRALDWDRLQTVLTGCRHGKKVLLPKYNFTNH